MRQNRFIATKDHFILLAASNELGDELWAGYEEFKEDSPTEFVANTIGFLIRGTANSFIKDSNNSNIWNAYDSGVAPLMLVRKHWIDFGLVATSNTSMFGSVIARESAFSGQYKPLTTETERVDLHEQNQISSSDGKTINVSTKCKVIQKRDIYNFDKLEQEPLDINTILDSEIEIEHQPEEAVVADNIIPSTINIIPAEED